MRPTGTTRAKKPIMQEDFDKLMCALHKNRKLQYNTRYKLIRAYTLLYVTGCRVSEILEFQVSDIQKMIENKEYSTTNRTKTKKSRYIPFSDKQVEILKNVVSKQEGYIFYRNNSNKPISVSKFTAMLNAFLHKILGDLYSTHSFRAGLITRLAQAKFDIKLIQEYIGHTNTNTTAKYIKHSKDDLINAVDSIF